MNILADPLLVIIEYVPYGDLLGYLRKSRGLNDTYFKDPDVKPQTSLTSQQLIMFSWQVADGMRYLSSRNVSFFHSPTNSTVVLIYTVFCYVMAKRLLYQAHYFCKDFKGRFRMYNFLGCSICYTRCTSRRNIFLYKIYLRYDWRILGFQHPTTLHFKCRCI